MYRISSLLIGIFLFIGGKDPTVLNPKLPVIVTVLKSSQQAVVENQIVNEFKKRNIKVISAKKAAEILHDEITIIRGQQSESDIRNIKPTGDGMMEHLQGLMDRIPAYAQRIYITLIQRDDAVVDSCYYYIRQQPEPLPNYSKRRTIDTKVFIPDSVLKKNDIGVLVSALVDRALTTAQK